MSKPKDGWDKLDIIGKGIVLPLAVAVFTIVANKSLSEISERMKVGEQDIGLMKTFKDIYYDKNSRRLAVSFTGRISDKQVREKLQTFIIWDALEAHITHHTPAEFVFDTEDDDWHMVGDALWERYLKTIETKEYAEFLDWWTLDIKDAAYHRWPTRQTELMKLFQWLETTYLQSDRMDAEGPINKAKLQNLQRKAAQANVQEGA